MGKVGLVAVKLPGYNTPAGGVQEFVCGPGKDGHDLSALQDRRRPHQPEKQRAFPVILVGAHALSSLLPSVRGASLEGDCG
jgi:hypothetical protein